MERIRKAVIDHVRTSRCFAPSGWRPDQPLSCDDVVTPFVELACRVWPLASSATTCNAPRMVRRNCAPTRANAFRIEVPKDGLAG